MNSKYFHIQLDKDTSNQVIGRIYLQEQELLSSTHSGTIAAGLFALGVRCLGFYTDGDPEAAISELETNDSACVVPVSDEVKGERFVDSVIGRTSMLINIGGGDHDHLYAAVHHLPPDLVVNRPSDPAPANLKAMLKERNKYVYYPDC